jgi:pentose-5-phosphate-3-epimerase
MISQIQFCFLDNPLPLIDNIHKRNMKAGVAISPDTLSTAITDEIADAADMLLVMTVYPGNNCYYPNSLNIPLSAIKDEAGKNS